MRGQGPLSGIKVVELAGIGPGPMCGMLFGDLGADVIRIDRQEAADLGIDRGSNKWDLLNRSKRSVAANLKTSEGVETVLSLVEKADILIEGMRPGVTERLGLGPDECWARNPQLVYGRVTGWGQTGPIAHAAGHDMNYIALTGALHAIGRSDSGPVPPLNLVGDFGGGALYLAFGCLAAVIEARESGNGQVVDAAMIDGASNLMTAIYGMKAAGRWKQERGSNILDTGAHFYDVYETKDGKYVSIGSIEKKFYAELLEKTGIDPAEMSEQMNPEKWPEYSEKLGKVIRTKTRDEWTEIMEGSDVCFAPVLDMDEAPEHPHNKARETFIDIDGVVQPNAAPRFSRTPNGRPTVAPDPGQNTDEVLTEWGFTGDEIERLKASGAVR
ncbi:CaiB/BaiF CoA transferase family protein [Minwuia thermotolerans]|uniref:Carnitine dehydratase n=1 Tax=Minwuia thermotolerans TaxID=2056226 RepID=A0A2M9G1D2_9PROT|nr:CaiB/BaiF CoA-transferase family protein [Minwuia thermotolerans]PJK29516.1 carnitine dehydratase [Minwuia thermotolerans]